MQEVEKLKELSPEERIKKLKELKEKQKEEIALADESIREVAEQLPYLDVRIKLSPVGDSGRCFSIGVTVSWKDQKINKRRIRRFQSITRSEI